MDIYVEVFVTKFKQNFLLLGGHILNEFLFSLLLIFLGKIDSPEHEDVVAHPEDTQNRGGNSDDAGEVIREGRQALGTVGI